MDCTQQGEFEVSVFSECSRWALNSAANTQTRLSQIQLQIPQQFSVRGTLLQIQIEINLLIQLEILLQAMVG